MWLFSDLAWVYFPKEKRGDLKKSLVAKERFQTCWAHYKDGQFQTSLRSMGGASAQFHPMTNQDEIPCLCLFIHLSSFLYIIEIETQSEKVVIEMSIKAPPFELKMEIIYFWQKKSLFWQQRLDMTFNLNDRHFSQISLAKSHLRFWPHYI